MPAGEVEEIAKIEREGEAGFGGLESEEGGNGDDVE